VHTSARFEVLNTRVFYVGTTSTSLQLSPFKLRLPVSNSMWPCHARIRTSTRIFSSLLLLLYTSFLLLPITTKSRPPRPILPISMTMPHLLVFHRICRPRGKSRGHGCSYTFQTLYEFLSDPTRRREYIRLTESPSSSSFLLISLVTYSYTYISKTTLYSLKFTSTHSSIHLH
jgi:hypothetical protein